MDNKSEIHKKTVAKYFSSKTEYWKVIYDESHDRDTFMNYLMRRRKQIILEKISNNFMDKHINILDVGCGTGVYTWDLAKRKYNVISMDISIEMLFSAKEKVAELANKNLHFFIADAEKIPLKNQCVDLVICAGLLEYLPDDASTLRYISKIAGKNGLIIFTLPNLLKLNNIMDPYYYFTRIWKYLKIRYKNNSGISNLKKQDFSTNKVFTNRRYLKMQIRNLVNNSGLKVEEIIGIGYGPFTFWRKQFIPLRYSRKISEFIERLASKLSMNFLNNFASRWIIVTRKK